MNQPVLIKNLNLSGTWKRVMEEIIASKTKEICPLVISITDFTEDEQSRKTLDESLEASGQQNIQTVAETIFPDSLYRYCNQNRDLLYNEYLNNIPRIKAIKKKANGRGTYFERLIAYPGSSKEINQLEHIIENLQSENKVRRTKLQASIFDPNQDHINSVYQGFPCLQHITFYKTPEKGLVINSFYAMQYLYKKAYGNWLGLINLGKFVAKELGIPLERFNCHIGIEKEDLTKKQMKDLLVNMNK